MELSDGVGEALRGRQCARVGQAQRGLGARLSKVIGDDAFSRRALGHQVQRHQGRTWCAWLLGLCLLGQAQGAVGIGGVHPGARSRHQHGVACGRGGGVGLERFFDRLSHRLGVVAALQEARQHGNECAAFGRGREVEQGPQRLADLGRAVQRQQDLQLQAQCILRFGPCAAPGARRGQCLVAGTPLQSDVHGTAEQGVVAGAPRSVEDDFEGRAGLALAQFDFADEDLIEERRVQR